MHGRRRGRRWPGCKAGSWDPGRADSASADPAASPATAWGRTTALPFSEDIPLGSAQGPKAGASAFPVRPEGPHPYPASPSATLSENAQIPAHGRQNSPAGWRPHQIHAVRRLGAVPARHAAIAGPQALSETLPFPAARPVRAGSRPRPSRRNRSLARALTTTREERSSCASDRPCAATSPDTRRRAGVGQDRPAPAGGPPHETCRCRLLPERHWPKGRYDDA